MPPTMTSTKTKMTSELVSALLEPMAIAPEYAERIRPLLVSHMCGEEELTLEALDAALGLYTIGRSEPTVYLHGDVAVINVRGTILRSFGRASVESVRAMLRTALDNPEARSIMLRISSPGGTSDGVAELADEIHAAREKKPVTAFIDELGASAAYWLAAQCEKRYCSETAAIGSIGVMIIVEDWSKMFERWGITTHVVKSTDAKGAGVWGTKITEEQLAEWQRRVDSLHAIFVRHVTRGLGISADEAAALADARVHTGKEAVKLGLADRVASFQTALNATRRLGQSHNKSTTVAVVATQSGEAAMPPEANELMKKAGAGPDNATAQDQTGSQDESTPDPKPDPKPAAQDEPRPEAKPATQDEPKPELDLGRNRAIAGIAEQFGYDTNWALEKMQGDQDITQIKDEVLAELAKSRKPLNLADVNVGGDKHDEFMRDASDALAAQGGELMKIWDPEKKELRPISPGAANFAHAGPLDIAKQYLDLHGVSTAGLPRAKIAQLAMSYHSDRRLSTEQAAAFGMSTADFPLVLADASNKIIQTGYEEHQATWDRWMRRGTRPDFKEFKVIETGQLPRPPQIPEGGEYHFVSFGERQEIGQLAKYGWAIGWTWELVVNNDTEAILTGLDEIGGVMSELENYVAYSAFLSNPTMADTVALFHADHNNLQSAGAINTANIDKMVEAMSLQQAFVKVEDGTHNDSGRVLAQKPSWLITGPTNRTAAKRYTAEPYDPDESISHVGNPHKDLGLQPVIEPLLQLWDAGTKARWYLASKRGAPKVYHLAGHERPYLERTSEGLRDAVYYRVRVVVAAMVDGWKGMQANLYAGA
jgi:signal peptide peptidase SppA